MSDQDSGERSEKASPRKLQKARTKGQVPRSKELTTAFILVVGLLSLMWASSDIAYGFASVGELTFSVDRDDLFSDFYLIKALASSIYFAYSGFALFFISLFLLSIISPIMIGGLTFSFSSLGFKANRLSPLSGFKRMFGANAGMELLKAIGKFSLVAVCAWLVIQTNFKNYMMLGGSTPEAEVVYAIELLLSGLLLISASLILIAFIDVPFQLWNHAKQLKMTKQELRDEYKETEGKPEVKSRIRQMQRELSHRRMMEAIPDADVVVTNPEHYSVAIKYDQAQAGAPIVVARGVDEVAFNIRKVAKAHEVPILEAPPLARALFHTTKLNKEIPAELYLAVAQVLAYVFQLNAYRKGQATKPRPLRHIELPDGMAY